MELVHLTKLGTKKRAIIREIEGGDSAVRRLDSMGIRPGIT